MSLPQSAIDARARRDARIQARQQERPRPKVQASRYPEAKRDKDIVDPNKYNWTTKGTALDAYKRTQQNTYLDRLLQNRLNSSKNTRGRASAIRYGGNNAIS